MTGLYVAGAVIVVGLLLLFETFWWPISACRRCKGTGRKSSSPFRKRHRACPKCRGAKAKMLRSPPLWLARWRHLWRRAKG